MMAGWPEHFERLILRRERDPMLVHGQAGDENRQVKIDAREGGEPECNPEEVELFHEGNMRRERDCHALSPVAINALGERVALVCVSAPPLIIPAMLDIRLIREQPDFVKERLATRGGR